MSTTEQRPGFAQRAYSLMGFNNLVSESQYAFLHEQTAQDAFWTASKRDKRTPDHDPKKAQAREALSTARTAMNKTRQARIAADTALQDYFITQCHQSEPK